MPRQVRAPLVALFVLVAGSACASGGAADSTRAVGQVHVVLCLRSSLTCYPEPLAHAGVTVDQAGRVVSTTTDDGGRFVATVPGTGPAHITVESPVIRSGRLTVDEMLSGGELTVSIEAPVADDISPARK